MDTDEGFAAAFLEPLECIDVSCSRKKERQLSEISPREIYREQKTVMTIDPAGYLPGTKNRHDD